MFIGIRVERDAGLFLLYPCKTFYHMTCIYQRQQIYTSVNHVIIIYAILCSPIGWSRYSTLEKFPPDRQVLSRVTRKVLSNSKSPETQNKSINLLFLALLGVIFSQECPSMSHKSELSITYY